MGFVIVERASCPFGVLADGASDAHTTISRAGARLRRFACGEEPRVHVRLVDGRRQTQECARGRLASKQGAVCPLSAISGLHCSCNRRHFSGNGPKSRKTDKPQDAPTLTRRTSRHCRTVSSRIEMGLECAEGPRSKSPSTLPAPPRMRPSVLPNQTKSESTTKNSEEPIIWQCGKFTFPH